MSTETAGIPNPAASPPEPPAAGRQLEIATAAFVLLHVYHGLVQGGGGWRARHNGFKGAIWQFFRLSLADPVLSAGLSDFAVIAVMFAVVMVEDLPPEQRGSLKVKLWLGLYGLFPGLGALVYRLWLKPSAGRA